MATQIICVGGSIPTPLTVAYVDGVGSPSYQWYNATTSTAINGATGVNFTPTSYSTAGIYEYYVEVTLTGSGCNVMSSAIAQINVIPDPVVSTQPISTSYCQNSPSITPLSVTATGGTGTYTYQWYKNTTNSNTGGTLITNATSSTYSPPVNNVGTFYYYCVIGQTGANCSVTSQVAVVDVNLQPTITSTNFGPQSVCVGGTTSAISVSYINGTGTATYQWYSNTTNSTVGGTAITNETSATFTPPSTTAGTTYYYCVISFSSGGCTDIISQVATIVIHPDPSLSIQPLATQSICEGGTIPTALTVNYINGTGTASYQWYVVGSPNTLINGAISSTYTPPAYTSTGTFEYYVEVSLNGSGCNTISSGVAQIVVIQDPTVNILSTSQNYCQFSSNVLPITSNVNGGSGTVSYQWYSNNINNNTNGVIINGAVSSTYIPSVSTVGTIYYYCVITQSGSNCGNVSNVIPIQTYLQPSITSIPFTTQAICIGGSLTPLNVSYVNGVPGATYQWYSNTTNSSTGGVAIAGATTNTYTPSNNFAGNYYYYCVISFPNGGCNDLISSVANVQIFNDPILTIQPVDGLDICAGSTLSTTYSVQISGGVGSYTVQWYDFTNNILTSVPGSNQLTFNPTPINTPGTYDYFANITYSASGCNALNSDTISLVVYPLPHVNQITDFTICNGNTFTVNLGTDIPANYVWSAIDNPSVSGEVFLTQTSSVISNTLTNNSTQPQNVQYTITPTSWPEGCQGPDSNFTVTVMPDITMSIPTTLEICSGASVNAVLSANVPSNFTWFTTFDNPQISGESITNNSGSIINDVLINNSTSNQLVIYSVFPTSINGNCNGPAQTIAVTIKPPLSLLSPDSITICSGQAVNLNLVANTNVTFNWYADQSLNVTGESLSVVSSDIINDVLTNNFSTAQDVHYSVIGTSTANGCSTPVFPVVVTVNPNPTISLISDQTYCTNVSTQPVVFVSNVQNVTFNWTNNNPSIGQNNSGTGSIPSFITNNTSYSPNIGTFNVYASYTNNNLTCNGTPIQFNLTVNPIPSIFMLQDQTLCSNVSTNTVNLNGPVTGTQYNWYSSNPTIGSQNSGIGNITSFITTNSTNTVNSSIFTITPSYTNNNVTCLGADSILEINVLPVPNVLPISNQTLCNNSSSLPVNFSSNVIGTAYTWSNNNQSIGLATAGNGDIPIFTSNNNGNTPSLATVVVTPSISQGNLTCIGNTTSFSYEINPTPSVDPTPNLTYCNNVVSLVDFNSTFMNNNTSVTYDWQNSNTTIGIPSSGSGDINFLATNPTTSPQYSTINVTPSYYNNGLTCYGSQETILVTINPTPTVDPISSQTFCATTNLQVNFSSSFNVPNTNYVWTNNNPTIGLASNGQGTISFTSQNTTSNPITSSINVTPTYTNAGTTCSGIAENFLITINPVPIVNSINNQIFCSGSNSTPVIFSSNVSNPSYSWTNSNVNIGLGSSGNGNIPSFVAQNTTTNVISGNIQVVVSYTNNGITCNGNNQIFTISVNPQPTVNPVQSQSLCNNDNTSQINFSGSVNGSTFSWTNSNPTIGLASSGTGNIPSFTASNNTNSVANAQVLVTPNISLNGLNCSGNPQSFAITVNPTPTISAISNVTYCNGTATNNIVFSSSISGTVYNWTNTNTAIGLSASGSGNINSFVATNTSSTPISSTITVIPTVTNNGISCSGNPQTFVITVNPTPVLADPLDQVVCSGSPVSAIIFNSSTPNTIFTWQNDTPTIGLSANGTGNIASFVANNTLTGAITATIMVTPSYTNIVSCLGTPQYFTITINPQPTVSDPNDLVLCNGTSTTQVNFVGTVPGTIFDWTNSNPTIGLGSNGTGNISSFTSNNSTFSPNIGVVSVTPIYTNLGVTCIGNPESLTITVNPIPNVVDPADQVVCNNSNTASIIFTGNVSGTVYNWTNSNNSIGLTSNGTGNINAFNAINTTTLPVTSVISVSSSYTNGGVTCLGNTETFTIIVNPSATLTTQPIQICSNENTNLNLSSSIPSTFSWQANNNINVQGETYGAVQNSSYINDILINNTNLPEIVNYSVSILNTQYGCSSGPFILPVTVNPLPDVQFNPINTLLCDLSPISFQNTTLGNNTYNWNFGDGGNSILQNPTYTYLNNGTYNVVLTATDNITGCKDSINHPIEILDSPPVGFVVSNNIGCEILDAVFTDTVNTPNTNLFWDFGDGITSNQNNFVDHQYIDTGCFNVTLTVTSLNGCTSSQTIQNMVCVDQKPIADFSTDNLNYLIGNSQVIFNNTSQNASWYNWHFGDGDSSSSTNPTHIYGGIGEYLITLYAYSNNGCYDSTTVTINVDNDVLIYVPNTITVDGDGINDIFFPVLGEAFLKDTYHLKIYDRWGELVFESFNYEVGWNGSYAGKFKAQDGTYTWVITVKIQKNKDYLKYVGHVNVLNSNGEE